MSELAPRYIRTDEYLTFERASSVKHEYLDGVVYPLDDPSHPTDPDVVLGLLKDRRTAMAGGTRAHSTIKINLAVAIGAHLADGPCRLYDNDLRVRPDNDSYFYPDLFVVCSDVSGADGDTEIDNPTLVIEVLSPSTERMERVTKLRRCAHAETLQEYVLINTRFPEVFVRRLEDGNWVAYSYEPTETVRLESIDFDLDFERIYRNVRFDFET